MKLGWSKAGLVEFMIVRGMKTRYTWELRATRRSYGRGTTGVVAENLGLMIIVNGLRAERKAPMLSVVG